MQLCEVCALFFLVFFSFWVRGGCLWMFPLAEAVQGESCRFQQSHQRYCFTFSTDAWTYILSYKDTVEYYLLLLFYPGGWILCLSQTTQILSRVTATLAKAPFKYYCLFWGEWASLNWELEPCPVRRGRCDPAGLFLASLSRGRHINPGQEHLSPWRGNKTHLRGCVALKIKWAFSTGNSKTN